MNIIITGASKGLGRAIAERYAEAKNTLFICARTEENLKNLQKELQQNYPQSIINIMPADLSIKKQITDFGSWCLQHAVPDIVINNAGSFIPGSVYNEEEGALEKMIEVNLYSAYHLTRLLLPEMMKRRSGHIFNMCSIAALQAYNNGGAYSISKFAMAGFSKNLRAEMMPYNIKVTTVYPGAAYTDSWSGSGVDENRLMASSDVAAIIYVASQLTQRACVEEIILRPQKGDL